MQINVTFRNMEPSDEVKSYVEDKLGKVKRYLLEPIEVNVVLKAEKFRHIAEVLINANGVRINASEETEDVYSAIDLLIDTVEAQIRKQLDKSRRKKLSAQDKGLVMNRTSSDEFSGNLEVSPDLDESTDMPVIYTETYDPKPMDVEEAILQLNATKKDFIVFVSQETGKVNVLYRRKDGNYGLIET